MKNATIPITMPVAPNLTVVALAALALLSPLI